MDELARIQTFIKVVACGSFSAAARDVSSVSSVARQIKSLEDDLGVRLVNRSTRQLSLTEPGRRFYERSCAIASNLGIAMLEAKSFQDSVKGTLRVSLRVAAGTTIVVPALPAFLERYPELNVDVILTDDRRDLIANNIDVAIWAGTLPDSEIVARRLSPSRRIVCGSPDYFKRHGAPQTPGELRKHNCLLYAARSYGSRWCFARSEEQEEIEVRGSVCSDNGLVLLSAAMSGIGLIVVHEWMVRRLLVQGQLVRVLEDYAVNPRASDTELSDLHAVYASSRGLSRKVRVFVDFLAQLFGGAAAV